MQLSPSPSSDNTHTHIHTVAHIQPEKFWDYSMALFDHQNDYSEEKAKDLTLSQMRTMLADLAHQSVGVDKNAVLEECVALDVCMLLFRWLASPIQRLKCFHLSIQTGRRLWQRRLQGRPRSQASSQARSPELHPRDALSGPRW